VYRGVAYKKEKVTQGRWRHMTEWSQILS
jgi:hypothetical protein